MITGRQAFIQWLREWTRPGNHGLVSGAIADATRSRSDLLLENTLLRQQLIVLERQIKRPRLSWRDRGIMVVLASRLSCWKSALFIVKPDTLVRWHREIFRLIWRRKSQADKPVGRPKLTADKVGLIQRLAVENPLWGAERIRGELLKLDMRIAKSSIQKYTQRIHVGDPRGQNWNKFFLNHASEIWACDFLQTYDALFRTIFVFVIIELESRRVVHFNVTRHPSDVWIAQQWREATPFGEGPTYLIRDNDRKCGAQFDTVTAGVEVLHTPIAAPKANAFCERFMGSLRRECLDYMLILSERHLYRIVKDMWITTITCGLIRGFTNAFRAPGRLPRTWTTVLLSVCLFWVVFTTTIDAQRDPLR